MNKQELQELQKRLADLQLDAKERGGKAYDLIGEDIKNTTKQLTKKVETEEL